MRCKQSWPQQKAPPETVPRQRDLRARRIGRCGPVAKEKSGNRLIVVIMDRYKTLTPSIPSSKITAPHVASIFSDQWVRPQGIPTFQLTDNCPEFRRNFFETLCALLGVKHLMTTAYSRQTDRQARLYNRTIVARLQH